MITEIFAQNIISICWIIFGLVWIFAWSWSKKTAIRKSHRQRTWYILTLLLGVVLFWIGGPVAFHANLTTLIIGDIFAIIGVVTSVWARFALGSNWSGSVQIKKDHRLITSGPYRFVRHPIYTGVLSLLLADLLLVGTVYSIIGFLVIAISFYIKLKLEEKYMLTQFPHEYPAYMKKVKRLIPFVF